MKILEKGNVIRLKLDEIVVEDRLRPVSEAGVQNLIMMAEETGITTPIHVRVKDGRRVLVDGAHRLAAAKEMGLQDIAALAVECTDKEARAMEASNNLGACRMTPLQTVVFVASWRRDYYERYPERKPGVFKGNRYTGSLVADLPDRGDDVFSDRQMSLSKSIAAAMGVTERTAFRALAGGEGLTPAEIALLEKAPMVVSMQDLQALAKVADAAERSRAITMFAEGKAKRIQAALRASSARQVHPKDPVEEAFKALCKAFERAPMAARRKFVAAHADELDTLLSEDATE